MPLDLEPPSSLLLTPLAQVVDPSRELYDARDTQSLRSVMQVLADRNILAVPVYSSNPDMEHLGVLDPCTNKTYIGMLSLLDIITYQLSQPPNDEKFDALGDPVSRALGMSMEGKRFWVAPWNATLEDGMIPLTEGVHRLLVPVVKRGGREGRDGEYEYHMCSQMDVVEYLYRHLDTDSVVQAKADSTLEELGLVSFEDSTSSTDGLGGPPSNTSTVISIESHWPASKAFKFMTFHSLHAVAVMHHPPHDSSSDSLNSSTSSLHPAQFIGTLSLSDLRHVPTTYLMSNPTILSLLLKLRKVASISDLPPPIACNRHSTLRQVMRMVVERRVHRVWVVEDGREEGGGVLRDVVSLTNVIQAFVWAKHVAGGFGEDE
ncbi:hypothetical protein HDV05_003465 [Chytridiales sp. JEL 0842]|nr:hypothetical protein HDV05_003465 [Chytridiales sp. JEL 0842]